MARLLSVVGVGVLCALPYVAADLPTDCRLDEVRGKWQFTLSDLTLGATPGQEVNCTAMNGQWNGVHTVEVDLLFPDVAMDNQGNVGRWTLVYNQGFEVYLGNQVFFAFSKYEDIPNSDKKYIYCGQTFDGWYHADQIAPRSVGCFSARKSNPREANARKVYTPPSEPGPVDPKAEEELKKPSGENALSLAARINSAQESWVATDYAPEIEEQINAATSMRKATRYQSELEIALAKAALRQSKEGTGSRLTQANAANTFEALDESLPKNWDWRNVNGVNYAGPVRNQGGCGSCYAFASAGVLEARYRIKSGNKLQPVLSPQQIVDCSPFSQGCGGGFPYLTAGKYAKDYGFVEESCLPYTGNQTDVCDHERINKCRRWYSNNHRYVGGFYGATTEYLMRKEIYENGPVAIGFQVYPDLKKYKSGIYHYSGQSPEKHSESWLDPLEVIDHAVVAVGYGEDETTGEKYWVIKNSWGEEWGEGGYFRIRRGVDEANVESCVVAADPVL